jgi:hypothetical protein
MGVDGGIKYTPEMDLSRPAAPRTKILIASITVLLAIVFLFGRLGHYSLWDDEANTALIGEGIWQTGDTSAVVGHNIYGYRNGAVLSNLKERYDPPLQFFLASPMVGLFPRSAFAARFPFALAGLASVCLILWWLHKARAPTAFFLLAAMGLIGNVSFWLYCRQCRYYPLAICFSVLVAFLYLGCKPNRKTCILLALASCVLIATNYLSYAAIYSAIGLDFLIWGRRRFKLSWQNWLILWLPQIVFGAVIVSIWSPLGKVVQTTATGGITDKLTLYWWAWRDMNWCEFGIIPLVLIAPLLWLWRRDHWLLRAPLALLCYVTCVVALSPQKGFVWINGQWVQNTYMFDVRYLAAAIPLLIGIAVLVIRDLFSSGFQWAALLVGTVAFGSNLLTLAWIGPSRSELVPRARSTIYLYCQELIDPPGDPYTPVAQWINQNVKDGESIWVLPDYMAYPLMFHAPVAVYGWQFDYPPAPQFRYLPRIQFKGMAFPDYIICFGPVLQQLLNSQIFPRGTSADVAAKLDFYGHDLYRPELLWRTFRPIPSFNKDVDGIYILHMKPPVESNFHL